MNAASVIEGVKNPPEVTWKVLTAIKTVKPQIMLELNTVGVKKGELSTSPKHPKNT